MSRDNFMLIDDFEIVVEVIVVYVWYELVCVFDDCVRLNEMFWDDDCMIWIGFWE